MFCLIIQDMWVWDNVIPWKVLVKKAVLFLELTWDTENKALVFQGEIGQYCLFVSRDIHEQVE